MRGRKLGCFLLLIAIALAYWAWVLGRGDVASSFSRVSWILAGATFSVGFGLFVFRRIILTPWFIINLAGDNPSLNIGPPGFNFSVKGEKSKGCIQVPGTSIFLYMSFMTRFFIMLGLAAVPYRMVTRRFPWHTGLLAAFGALVVLYLIDKAILKALAPSEDEEEKEEPAKEEPKGTDSDEVAV